MNQTSHPPARPKKSWVRALCTAALALCMAGAAHAQNPTVRVGGGSTISEPGDATPTSTNITVTASTATGGGGATVSFRITGDTSATAASTTPTSDLTVSTNGVVTGNPDGSYTGTVFIGPGSTSANIRVGAVRDSIAELAEGFRVSLTGVTGSSSATPPGNYAIDTGADDTVGNVGAQSFTPGYVEFTGFDRSVVYENARGTVANPVKTFNVRLRGDIPNNATEESTLQYSVKVRVTATVTFSNGGASSVSPLLATDPSDPRAQTPGDGSASRIQDFIFPAGDVTQTDVKVYLVYTGDDAQAPLFSNNNIFQDQTANAPVITISARIIQNNPPSNLPSLYPNTSTAGNGVTDTDSFLRFSPQGIDLAAVTTNFVTAEDPNATAANSVGVTNPDGTTNTTQSYKAYIPVDLQNLELINPDGTINTDAQPKADIFIPLTSQDTTEGLLSYFTVDSAGKVTFIQSIPQSYVTLRYSTDPNSPEYFANQHWVIATGVDDTLQDGDVIYQLRFSNPTSTDTEFAGINFYDFTIISLRNTDNEQTTTASDAGVLYTSINTTTPPTGGELVPALTTNESGSRDSFGVRLRTAPTGASAADGTGYVTLTLTSSRPDEVLLVDPVTGNLETTIRLKFYATTPAAGLKAGESLWNQNLTVFVQGIDDNSNPVLDGSQTATINILTEDATTSDSIYQLIDPADPIVTNQDNESTSFTVTPTNVVVSEGSSTTFTVRINSVPTFPVTVNLTNSDPTSISISPSSLTFTGTNREFTVTVSGISDSALTPTARVATIGFDPAISSDTNYNGIDIPDVTVTVLNTDTLFTLSKTSGLVTTESGGTDSFTVALKSRPNANVTLTLKANSNPNLEAQVRTTGVAGNTATLTFTPANYATPQTVTVIGVNDNVPDGEAPFTITGTTTSTDTAFTGQVMPTVSGVNKPQSIAVSPTTGLITTEAGGTANFTVTLTNAPTADVVITLTANNPAEAVFDDGSTTRTLTFTTANVGQTVTVKGVDDTIDDGDQPFTITGVIASTDGNYASQTFPSVSGTNTDDDSTPGVGGTDGSGQKYDPGTRNLISYPYTTINDTSTPKVGTATVAEAFGPMNSSTGVRYTIYRYDSARQKYSLTTSTGGLGTDWVALTESDTLNLGEGYLLVVGSGGTVAMNTPADNSDLVAISGTSFPIALKRNPNFQKETRKSQSFNGYNLIGFPFNPSTYSSVNLSNVQVAVKTTNKKNPIKYYETLSKAAAAGVIKGRLYGLDSQGRLVQLSASSYTLSEFQALFVQSFKNTGDITLTLRNPS